MSCNAGSSNSLTRDVRYTPKLGGQSSASYPEEWNEARRTGEQSGTMPEAL
eukprot:CAMPEP_0180239588 /NCGR_PEP_ID=MMETSP0987-20121128/31610_1 /TAXON_ID=697907 /ORGANISM="non described non described, Strain CCMP2293" /LENGTH=50 /DNA_ID=CAMNT_0022206325 /DNA_START=557 /DNA_END=709 /DNA_ORIENTATION=-